MFEQFLGIQGRFDELSTAVSQPEVIADQAKYQQLLKERAILEPQVEAWHRYQTCLHQLEEARSMLDDPDLGEVAQAEAEALSLQKEDMERQLKLLLLPRDPDDDKNVVMEIRGGAGGDEASLFGASLLRMYLRYAERHGFRSEMISANMTGSGRGSRLPWSPIPRPGRSRRCLLPPRQRDCRPLDRRPGRRGSCPAQR